MACSKKRFRGVVACAIVVLVAGAPEVSSQIDRSRPRPGKARGVQSSPVQGREGGHGAVRPRSQPDRLGRPEMRSLPGEATAGDSRSQVDDGGEFTMEAVDLSTERQRREQRRAELEARRLRRQAKIRQRLQSDPAMFDDDEEMLDLDDGPPRRRGARTIEPFEGLIEVDAEPVQDRRRSTYASRLRELDAERSELRRPPRRRLQTRELDDRELDDRELDDRELDDRELDDRELDDRELDDRRDPIPPARRLRSLDRPDRRQAAPPPTIQRQLQDARTRTFGTAPRRQRAPARRAAPASHRRRSTPAAR